MQNNNNEASSTPAQQDEQQQQVTAPLTSGQFSQQLHKEIQLFQLPTNYMDTIYKAVMCIFAGNYENALVLFNSAIAMRPHYWRAHFHKANYFITTRRVELALTEYQRLLDQRHINGLDDTYALVVRGCIVENTRPLVPAAIGRAPIKLQGTHEQLKKQLIQKREEDVEAANKIRIDAIELYEQALQLEPDNYHANFLLGSLLIEMKQYKEALPHFEKASKNAQFNAYV